MKNTIIILVLILCSCAVKKVYYEPAPVDAILTCCSGDGKSKDDHYVIMSRIVLPKQTQDKECTKRENVFYRITEYPNGDMSLTLVCKTPTGYIELEDERMSRDD
jgi:hypothetical protein